MIIINVNEQKGLEFALKQYKNKVRQLKQTQELRNRQEFVKPSVTKRTQRLKAVYIQQMKNGLES